MQKKIYQIPSSQVHVLRQQIPKPSTHLLHVAWTRVPSPKETGSVPAGHSECPAQPPNTMTPCHTKAATTKVPATHIHTHIHTHTLTHSLSHSLTASI